MVNDVRLDALARGETVFDETVRASQLEQARGLAERWHGTADGRIHAIVAATGLSTSSPDLLRGIVTVPISSESASQFIWDSGSSRSFGKSTVASSLTMRSNMAFSVPTS